jgi:hypothetical protein
VRQNGREHAGGDGVVVTSPAGMRSLSAMVMAVRRLRHRISYRLVQTVLSTNLSESRCSSGGVACDVPAGALQTSLSGTMR